MASRIQDPGHRREADVDRKRARGLAFAVLAAAGLGCATTVRVDFDPAEDFGKYRRIVATFDRSRSSKLIHEEVAPLPTPP